MEKARRQEAGPLSSLQSSRQTAHHAHVSNRGRGRGEEQDTHGRKNPTGRQKLRLISSRRRGAFTFPVYVYKVRSVQDYDFKIFITFSMCVRITYMCVCNIYASEDLRATRELVHSFRHVAPRIGLIVSLTASKFPH